MSISVIKALVYHLLQNMYIDVVNTSFTESAQYRRQLA